MAIGDGTTAVTAADTDLSAASGASNRWFQTPDATFPSISGTTVTWQVTVTGTNADFAWSEFGIDNGTSNGTTVTAPLLDHGLASLGTKAASTSWQLQVAITES